MRFTIILDSTSSPKLLDSIKRRVSNWVGNNPITFDVYILHNGISIDSDSNLLISVLSNEKQRSPVIMDMTCAKLYPEIIKFQETIISINNDNIDVISDIENMLSIGALFDVFDESNNSKMICNMMVIDIDKYFIDPAYYSHLYHTYKNEHIKFPVSLLSRESIIQCKGNWQQLVEFFEDRNNKRYSIGWSNTIKSREDFRQNIPKFVELENTAIKTFSDERIRNRPTNILFNPKPI